MFFLYEIKNILSYLKYKLIFIKNYSLINYSKFKKNELINPSKDEYFKKYINENYKVWKNLNIKKKKISNKILVTSFVHLPQDAICHGIVAKYLQDKFKFDLIGFIDKENLEAEIILRSFGVKNFIYLSNQNILIRIKYFLQALKIIKKFDGVSKFLKFKYNKIDIGKTVYEHILRHTGVPSTNNINFKFILHLSEAIRISIFCKNIFLKHNIKAVVQTENQFIPSNIIFLSSLINNINVFAREAAPQKISIRKYSNFTEAYTARTEPSKKLFQFILNNYRSFASKNGEKIVKQRFKGLSNFSDSIENPHSHIGNKFNSKKEICQKLKWKQSKPIVCIFSHTFVDGNFLSGWRIFRDNYSWLNETLQYVSKLKKINWLVKPHPMDAHYINLKINSEQMIKKFCTKYNHIHLFPKNVSLQSAVNFASSVVTSNGTIAFEFACFKKPCVLAARSSYSDLIFKKNYIPSSKREYFILLNRANKAKAISKLEVQKAKIFSFIKDKLIRTKNPLLANIIVKRNFNRKKFWISSANLAKKYSFKRDKFRKLFYYQLEKNNRHTINLNILKGN